MSFGSRSRRSWREARRERGCRAATVLPVPPRDFDLASPAKVLMRNATTNELLSESRTARADWWSWKKNGRPRAAVAHFEFFFFDLSGFASEFSVGAPGVSRINLRTGTKKRLETCTNLMMVLSLCLPESFCI